MCFSPEVSFAAAGVLGALGAVSLAKASTWRETPLAAIPLLFAAQQALEGLIWLSPAGPGGQVSGACVVGYLGFAKVLWPTYAPLAVLLVEPSAVRRQIMAVCAAVGAMVSVYLAYGLATWPQWADRRASAFWGGHIVYHNDQGVPLWVGGVYLLFVSLAFLASSEALLVTFGAVLFGAAVVIRLLAPFAFPSIWCFFGAAASTILAMRFVRRRTGGFTKETCPAR